MKLLVEQFIEQFTTTFRRAEKKISGGGPPNPLARGGATALVSAARYGEKILFAESTMAMLLDKLKNFDATVEELYVALGSRDLDAIMARARTFRGGWIQFPKPIAHTWQGERGEQQAEILAMLAFVPSVYIPTGKDTLQLHLLDGQATIVEVISELAPGNRWAYDNLWHQCRACARSREGLLLPCERCRHLLNSWGKIFGLSAIIAGQYLAETRYEEKEFTAVRRIPRSKSEKKERRITIKHLFKVIDANEILVPVLVGKEEKASSEQRGSWIDDDTLYETITTRPFSRTYRHPRYVNVQGTTVSFPEGITRLQPKKRANLGKTITKVKASLYENEER